MKTLAKSTIFVILILTSCKSSKNFNTDNETLFIGYEKIGILDPSKPEMLWFWETKIKFKNDSVYIDQNPINIYKNDTLYSESDGGFHYYKGIKIETGDKLQIKTIEIGCDFCPTEVKTDSNGKLERIERTKNYEAKLILGNLKIDERIFKKAQKQNLKLRSEYIK